MFCTIITYLIWFCCCFYKLVVFVWRRKRVKKLLGNLILWYFRWWMLEGCIKLCSHFFPSTQTMECENQVKNTRGNSVRKTVLARGDGHQAPHNGKCVYKSLRSPTKLKFIPHTTYIDRNEGLYTAKYCTIRVLNLCGVEMNMQITREGNLQCFHTWNEINIFLKLFDIRGLNEW
jgi:hypothetical protein